jgi:hypothetical protein
MKMKLNLLLLLTLGISALTIPASAQSPAQSNRYANPRVADLVYSPGQNPSLLRLADWDDHHRCDGDHDRDDRNCYWQGRDRDRYRQQYYNRGYGYYGGNGYYGSPYGQNGWYDKHGNWHVGAYGWYDRKGKWHSNKHHSDGYDR